MNRASRCEGSLSGTGLYRIHLSQGSLVECQWAILRRVMLNGGVMSNGVDRVERARG